MIVISERLAYEFEDEPTIWRLYDRFLFNWRWHKYPETGTFLSIWTRTGFIRQLYPKDRNVLYLMQDSLHFDTVIGNVLYQNPDRFDFIAELNCCMNEFIENHFKTYHPSQCTTAAAA